MSEQIESTGLVKYDAMQRAIVAASAVDEVKDIRDKALALEKYAQQARNFDAERRAAQIRIHAEMKGGQLLKATEKAKGARSQLRGSTNGKGSGAVRLKAPENAAKTLKELGVSETQSSRWQQLAANPKAVEKYLAETEDVPTTAGALAAVQPKKRATPPPLPFSEEALWLTSRLHDLNERGIDPKAIASGLDEHLRRDLAKHIDYIITRLTRLKELL